MFCLIRVAVSLVLQLGRSSLRRGEREQEVALREHGAVYFCCRAFVVGRFRRRASTPLVCCVTDEHAHVYACDKAVCCLPSFTVFQINFEAQL